MFKKILFFLLLAIFLINEKCYSEDRNEGWHFELLGNSSVFAFNSGNDSYLGYYLTPELRFRYGINKDHSIFLAGGYGQISQFTDEQEDTEVMTRRDDTKYSTTIGWAFNLKDDGSKFEFGFDHLIIGLGYGNFETNRETKTFQEGPFVFVGFTINVLDVWLSKP